MITLKKKQEVLLMHLREGCSQREISTKLGVDRKTVRKYIKEYEYNRNKLINEGDDTDPDELIQAMIDQPKYRTGERLNRSLTADMEGRIDELLRENQEKKMKGMHKQQKKVIDIHEVLESEGYVISYSTVLRTVRQKEKKIKEAFIRGRYQPGDICEFDWGEVKLYIGNELSVFQMAAFTSAYGNYRAAYLFTKQKTECFQEAHAHFFKQVDGVYQTIVYDNMKVAVRRFVGTEKEPTEGLLKLSLYYGFSHRFCNAKKGNEKGHVERSVEYIRRKAFAYEDRFETLEEANEYLAAKCEDLNQRCQTGSKQTANDYLEEERPFLLPALPMFDAARVSHPRVDKYATVVIDQNHYSVPDHLVGEILLAKIYSTRIQLFHNGKKAAEHDRLTGNHEWRIDLYHYIHTLKKKPGTLANSVAMQQADKKIKTIYEMYYTKKPKGFIELIHYLQKESSLKEVEESIEELRSINPSHVTTEKIKVLCARNKQAILNAMTDDTNDIVTHARAHLKAYDVLFQTETLGAKEITQ